jgi:hypothetical protein
MGLRPVEVDPSTSYRVRRSVPLLDQGDGEEVRAQLKVRFDPQESLTQHDEGCDLLDPIRVEVLQLYLIVMEEPLEEGMKGRPKPTIMEVREGDDVAITWRQQLLAASTMPLLGSERGSGALARVGAQRRGRFVKMAMMR